MMYILVGLLFLTGIYLSIKLEKLKKRLNNSENNKDYYYKSFIEKSQEYTFLTEQHQRLKLESVELQQKNNSLTLENEQYKFSPMYYPDNKKEDTTPEVTKPEPKKRGGKRPRN